MQIVLAFSVTTLFPHIFVVTSEFIRSWLVFLYLIFSPAVAASACRLPYFLGHLFVSSRKEADIISLLQILWPPIQTQSNTPSLCFELRNMFNDLLLNSSACLTSQMKALRYFGTSVCPQILPSRLSFSQTAAVTLISLRNTTHDLWYIWHTANKPSFV